ncbi:hypothetical protein RLIN73S_06064 [Rhodanobacter lindaniclasticus]
MRAQANNATARAATTALARGYLRIAKPIAMIVRRGATCVLGMELFAACATQAGPKPAAKGRG